MLFFLRFLLVLVLPCYQCLPQEKGMKVPDALLKGIKTILPRIQNYFYSYISATTRNALLAYS
jgi:hypothetical protein